MSKRFLCLISGLLAALLLFAPAASAQGEFSFCPAFFAFADRYDAGESVSLALSGHVNKLLPFEAEELAIINSALDGASLTLTAARDASGAFALSRGGLPVLSFAYRDDLVAVNDEVLLLGPVGQEQLIPRQQADLWDCLKAIHASLPHMEQAVSLLAPVKAVSGTVISNIGSMREGRAYTLSAEAAQLFLTGMSALLPEASGMDAVKEAIALCSASGEITLTFYMDAHGDTVCCEGAGPLLIRETDHTFRFLIAMNDTGINCSFTASAAAGKGLYRVGLKAKVSEASSSQKDLSGSAEWTVRTDEGKYSLTGEAVLSSRARAEGDTLTGRITWTETDGGTERVYTLRPDLLFSADQGAGTLSLTQKKGDTTLFSMDLNAVLTMSQPVLQDAQTPNRVDAYASERIEDALLKAFAGQMAALDQQDMYLLTHALRSDAWMESTTDLQKVYSIFDFQVEE